MFLSILGWWLFEREAANDMRCRLFSYREESVSTVHLFSLCLCGFKILTPPLDSFEPEQREGIAVPLFIALYETFLPWFKGPKFTNWTLPFFSLFLFFFFVVRVVAAHTVIRFVPMSAKLGLCNVMVLNLGVNGTIIEAKIHAYDTWMCVF